jgi:type II secretory pathway pseudopilin PulG
MAERGYTLLELTLVCLLTVLVCGLGANLWGQAAEQVRLQSAGRTFAAALIEARSQAITRNVSLRLHINPDGRHFSLVPPHLQPALWRPLPSGVSFSGAPRASPVFYSRGSVVPAGTFLLRNEIGTIRVVVSPGGRIRWERDP